MKVYPNPGSIFLLNGHHIASGKTARQKQDIFSSVPDGNFEVKSAYTPGSQLIATYKTLHIATVFAKAFVACVSRLVHNICKLVGTVTAIDHYGKEDNKI